jgi:hypothetical protein
MAPAGGADFYVELQDVADAPLAELREHREPELTALVGAIHMPRMFLRSIGKEAHDEVDALVRHHTLVPDLDHQGVQVHDQVGRGSGARDTRGWVAGDRTESGIPPLSWTV